MRFSLIETVLVFSCLILFINTSSAQLNITSNDTIQLWVTVAEKTMVDIQPDLLAWQDVDPGTQTDISQAFGFPKEAVQIENIGSTNISYIWFNNSYPSSLPFGSGSSADYDAGNFAVIRMNQTNADYFFINRVEYNESELIYLQLPVAGTWAHGRFRSANHEWFWTINTITGTIAGFSTGTIKTRKGTYGKIMFDILTPKGVITSISSVEWDKIITRFKN